MAGPLNIVIVEDNDILREELVAFLQRPGWRVRGADCGEQLDALLRERAADIAVLDLNLPFEDGLSIARRLRDALPGIGIVVLTARTLPSDRTRGYGCGVDVYLTKPTNVEELAAVVHNLGSRLRPAADTALVLDLAAGTLSQPGSAPLRLTEGEARLMHALALAPDRRQHSALLADRAGDTEGPLSRENLAVLVCRLRAKLERDLAQGDAIRSVRGYGYRLAPVVRIAPGGSAGAGAGR